MDILRPFRSCFYCKGRDGLLHVALHPAYEFTKHYYYHKKCLKVVLGNPENHADFVDMALDIVNGIELERKSRDYAIERTKETYRRAKEAYREICEK